MAREPILVVDDNAQNLKLTRVILAAEGYDVRTAVDAEDALRILDSFVPRLILMDLQLPRMDGLELTRLLKADPARREIIIIALTAYAMKGDDDKAFAAGCDGYMSKPVDTVALPKMVAEHLARRAGGGAAAGAKPVVLVVEDNPITRKMLRLTLETEGYGVMEAPDARTALAAVAQTWPDLILQDLILPDMDGFELLRRLRDLPRGAELPILALSGFLSRLEEARTESGGFTALLVKPIEPSRLADVVRVYLPQPAMREPAVGERRRLLVVDDDPVQLKLARLHFTQLGFEVSEAGGAAEALYTARATHPDVILVDVFMPEIDGFQLCLEIRQDPQLGTMPVVLLSGQHGATADQDLATRVGANALVLRTPDFENAALAIAAALLAGAPAPAERPNSGVESRHTRLVIHHLERQIAAVTDLTQRCGIQAAQLSLLGGIAEALTRKANVDATLRDVLAATLDAAGISKGALMLRDATGALTLRQDIGFSAAERSALLNFFGHRSLLEDIVARGGSVSVPSTAIADDLSRDILVGAGVASAQIVPLISSGEAMGVMIIGATLTDVTSRDSVAFARAMGNQVVQSLELARSVTMLTASEQRYRTLLESANDYIAVLTPDGIVREMNQRWIELTGRPHDQLVGRDFREFAPTGQGDDILRTYHDTRAANAARTPIEIAGANGAHVLMEFSSTDVDLGGERLVFTIGRDVTEQRQLSEQLRQAQKLEAVGQLAGGVAHDFNNVLTAILGFSEMMTAETSPEDPRHADLLEITRAGERAAALTRQLLAFSRKQNLQPTVLDINNVISGVQSMLRRLIAEHVQLTMSLMPEIGLIRMDPTQLEQILVNLVVNAADAMPRGGTLTIGTGAVTLDEHYQQRHLPVAKGDYVVLTVSDTGVGMDEPTIRRIFEPFFTTKDIGSGTGLGLANVYGIVKQSGGDIWVSSELRRGASFTIYLPRVTDPVTRRIEAPAKTNIAPRGSETILLVEDDDGVRLLARVMLERTGYRVLQAGNPKEAMQVVNDFSGPIDLLLSDVIMPESEGPPLFERLITARPGLRVLYMSGYADDAISRLGVLIEGTPFLQKPFTPVELARKVRDVLEASPSPSIA